MKILYTKTHIISKLKKVFWKIFSKESTPTKEHLFDLLISVLCLNEFQSVKFNYEHYIENMSEFKLKSYYFTLNESRIDLTDWLKNIVNMALSIIPLKLKEQPIILSVDDTMVEKYGEKFENSELLFDHAKHNGSNYLKGHCFVSLMLSIPVLENNQIRYISFPVGYRMWTKEKTKLAMAAELVKSAMTVIGSERNVCLCCDSWYPKSEILSLPDEFENLAIICNARRDTVLYELPPEPTHKKGRPKVHGEKIAPDDFIFTQVKGTDYSVGCRQVMTKIFGSRSVYAIATKSKGGCIRLFFCTKAPQQLHFDLNCHSSGKSLLYAQTDINFLPLTIYSLRWNIEVAYYEQKKFWSLSDYMLRSKVGIERLINLLTLLYALMLLLPFYDNTFYSLSHNSPQQSRFVIGMTIQRELFFVDFRQKPKPSKNPLLSLFSFATI